jgi:cholesterol transport system auxiliary component
MKWPIILFVGATTLSGCNFLGPQAQPRMSTYTLSATASTTKTQVADTPTAQPKITLLVTSPTAAAGYESRHMLYTDKPLQLSEFAQNQWAAPPAEMLEPLLVQKLRDTAYFHAVTSHSLAGSRDYILRTHLIELRQDFTLKPSRIQLTLQAELISAVDNRIVRAKTFTTTIPAEENTPYAGVLAANYAINQLLTQIAQFCVQSIG